MAEIRNVQYHVHSMDFYYGRGVLGVVNVPYTVLLSLQHEIPANVTHSTSCSAPISGYAFVPALSYYFFKIKNIPAYLYCSATKVDD